MPVSRSAKPLPAKLAASAFWFPTIGTEANNNMTAIIARVPTVIVVLYVWNISSAYIMDFILFICSRLFDGHSREHRITGDEIIWSSPKFRNICQWEKLSIYGICVKHPIWNRLSSQLVDNYTLLIAPVSHTHLAPMARDKPPMATLADKVRFGTLDRNRALPQNLLPEATQVRILSSWTAK
jgi:hypothetical protein